MTKTPREKCGVIIQHTIMGSIKCANKRPCPLHDIPNPPSKVEIILRKVWDKGHCAPIRNYNGIPEALSDLASALNWELEKIKEGNYINSPDAQKAITDCQSSLRKQLKGE